MNNAGLIHMAYGDERLQRKEDPTSDYDAALSEFRKAVGISPEDWRMQANLGFMLERAKHPEEAIQPLEEALRLHPGEPSIQQCLERAKGHR